MTQPSPPAAAATVPAATGLQPSPQAPAPWFDFSELEVQPVAEQPTAQQPSPPHPMPTATPTSTPTDAMWAPSFPVAPLYPPMPGPETQPAGSKERSGNPFDDDDYRKPESAGESTFDPFRPASAQHPAASPGLSLSGQPLPQQQQPLQPQQQPDKFADLLKDLKML